MRDLGPECMYSVKHSANRQWSIMVTEREIRLSMIICILIVFACIGVITIITMKNIIISVIMMYCLATVVLSTLTFLNLFGWDLRITENAIIMIMIGFSVDHIYYLALGYIQSDIQDRDLRIKSAYLEMGKVIFYGTCTLVGASLLILPSSLWILK